MTFYKEQLKIWINTIDNLFEDTSLKLVQDLNGKVNRNDYLNGYCQIKDSEPSKLYLLCNDDIKPSSYKVSDFYYKKIKLKSNTIYILKEDTSFRNSTYHNNLNIVFRYKFFDSNYNPVNIIINKQFSISAIYDDYFQSRVQEPNLCVEILDKNFNISKIIITENKIKGKLFNKILSKIKINKTDFNFKNNYKMIPIIISILKEYYSSDNQRD